MVLSGLIGDALSQTSHGGSPALLTLLANCSLNRNLGPERFKKKKKKLSVAFYTQEKVRKYGTSPSALPRIKSF